jgi:hypothetical protein
MPNINIGPAISLVLMVGCAVNGPNPAPVMNREIINRPFKNNALASQQLKHFVFEYDPRADMLPKCIDPTQTIDFIRQQLQTGTLGREEAVQIVELADFYNLKQLAPDFLKALIKQDPSEERFLMAIAFTRAVGVLSEGEAWARGRDHFRFLLSSRFASSHMPELLGCLDAYMPKEDPQATSERMGSLIQTLQTRAETDAEAGTQMRNLEDIQNNTLPRIVKAAEIKQAILAIPDGSARLDRLVMIYLKLSMHYHEWLDRWAVRFLLRDYYRTGAVEPVKAFQRALENTDRLALPDESKQTLRRLCYHAIDFFGGSLSEGERNEAKTLAPHSAGLLSLDPQCPR